MSGGATETPRPHYFGIGCFTTFIGFVGGGMIAVLIAKIVGAATKCASDKDTGAPCNWYVFWLYGAIIGAVVVPTVAITLLRRSRRRLENSERG